MPDNQTQGKFKDITDKVEPRLRPICIALRELITACHQDFVEIIWAQQCVASYSVGAWEMSGHYAYISPQEDHVNLGFYHGASLSDSNGLLEGTKKWLRHIEFRNVSEVNHLEIEKLLAEANNFWLNGWIENQIKLLKGGDTAALSFK
jgi:hypothetical protein